MHGTREGGQEGVHGWQKVPRHRGTSIALSRLERVGLAFCFLMCMIVWVCIGLWIANGAYASVTPEESLGMVHVQGEVNVSCGVPGSTEKLHVSEVEWDTDTGWESESYQYTPHEAGVYLVTVGFQAYEAMPSGGYSDITAFKNGVDVPDVYLRSQSASSSLGSEGGAAGEVYMNGTTDHLEVWGGCPTYAVSHLKGLAFFTATLQRNNKAGGEAGPEGKEGPPGPEGPEGKEGPAGEAGGSGSGSKSEVTNFGPEAQATFSEGIETMETVGWCIVGTMLAGCLAFMTWRVTAS
jgi:hypothetical protein